MVVAIIDCKSFDNSSLRGTADFFKIMESSNPASSSSPRTIELRSLPRILEQVLLGLDPETFRKFCDDYCASDCIYELSFFTDGSPHNANELPRRSVTYNNTQVFEYIQLLHMAIPDAIFLIHDSQVSTKAAQGTLISCKFSFTGNAVLDFEAECWSPKNLSAATTPKPPDLMDVDTVVSDQRSKSIHFTGDVTTHANDTVKRKFSTVGRYIDTTHLHHEFEVIKRTEQNKAIKFPSRNISQSEFINSSNINDDGGAEHNATYDRAIGLTKTDSESMGSPKSDSNQHFFLVKEATNSAGTTPQLMNPIGDNIPSPHNLTLLTSLSSPKKVQSVGSLKMFVNFDEKKILKCDCHIYCSTPPAHA